LYIINYDFFDLILKSVNEKEKDINGKKILFFNRRVSFEVAVKISLRIYFKIETSILKKISSKNFFNPK
jgi:hypothetical protein